MRANPICAATWHAAIAGPAARGMTAGPLDTALRDAHQYTAALVAAIGRSRSAQANGWEVPRMATINPPLWEYGHLAWFAEWWILRDPAPSGDATARDAHAMGDAWLARRPSMLRDADRWFDSANVAHDTRWTLALPAFAEIAAYVRDVGDQVRGRLADGPDGDDDALYPYRLALFHEDMHAEALTYLCQTLDYPAPDVVDASLPTIDPNAGAVALAGGRFVRGVAAKDGFAFDNEREAAPVELAPFTIDRACVSNDAFRAFVEDGGYRDAHLWPGDAGRWRTSHAFDHPMRWRRDGASWQERWFGAWRPLPLTAPVCHVNAFEAEAFCRWAGRRLPRENEWEYAATHSSSAFGTSLHWGLAVWEWTADPFEPYPGFRPDRYREYSAPWFGTHRAVRGGSFATHPRMRHPRYRNFYTPERNDLFIGFRTCAR